MQLAWKGKGNSMGKDQRWDSWILGMRGQDHGWRAESREPAGLERKAVETIGF